MLSKSKKKKPNLRDVARAADVSVATVSRVLNTPDVVNKETRARVEGVIEELGFVRSAAARAINSGRTRLVGALIPTLDSDIFSLTVSSIEQTLEDFGLSLIVATTDDDREKEARKAQELLDVGVEGIFLTGTAHSTELYDLLHRTRVPTVAISYFDASHHLPTIGYDNRLAAELASAHLLKLGHRRIAVLHGPLAGNDRTTARIDGARTALSSVTCQFYETELTVGGGAEGVVQALAQDPKCDAIFCLSDVIAFGVLNQLQRAGISVPQDLSVISIHDLPASEHTFPPLTTVHLPARQMGRQAAESLATWVEDDRRPDAIYLESWLVERGSTTHRSSD